MNYKEFAEESDYTYHLEGYKKNTVSFYDDEDELMLAISNDKLFTLGNLTYNTIEENELIMEFLSKDNQDDWFNVEENEPDMVQIDGLQLTREDAERLLHSLEEKLNK